MIYTPEEKTKMDILLQAFHSYVDRQEDYDVVYSRKAGYLRICTGEGCDTIYFPIAGFADMVRMFADDFLSDEETRAGHYMKQNYDHVRGLLALRLDTLGEFREEAYQIVEQAIEANRVRCARMRQEQLDEIKHMEKMLQYLRGAIL